MSSGVRSALLAAATAGVLAALLMLAVRAFGQVQPGTCQTASLVINGSFEEPVIPDLASGKPRYKIYPDALVPGWRTSSSDRQVELWQSGFLGAPAAQGEQL